MNKFVNIYTGEVAENVVVQGERFYTQSELRKDGQPSGRAKGTRRIVSMHGRLGGYRYAVGNHAPLMPEVEAVAEPVRARIEALKREAEALERELQETYSAACQSLS